MAIDTIREWLSEHPRVVTALFVGGLYLSFAIELGKKGAGSAYDGP